MSSPKTKQKPRNQKKIKAREKRAKDRVVKRREATQMALKKEKEYKEMLEKDVIERAKLNDMTEEEKQEHIIGRLKYNLEVLQALEDQYLKEEMAKKDLHEQLEAEGHTTMNQKMEALKERFRDGVLEMAKEEGNEVTKEELDEAMSIDVEKIPKVSMSGSAKVELKLND